LAGGVGEAVVFEEVFFVEGKLNRALFLGHGLAPELDRLRGIITENGQRGFCPFSNGPSLMKLRS
jgi:hypothetical protein